MHAIPVHARGAFKVAVRSIEWQQLAVEI